VVALGQETTLPRSTTVAHLRRQWRQQWQPAARLEAASAGVERRNRHGDYGLSLSARNQQVEQIEHRLFSFISLNWRGKPLVNYETVINLIGGTRTRGGLKVKAVLDTNQYETGIEVSDEAIDQLRLKRHKVHPEWNYTLLPRA
jgi:Rhodopirellula transposase DDE domain